jgi:NitT/TauT family transport system permease protein
MRDRLANLAWQALLGIGLIALWQALGLWFGTAWISAPSLVALRLRDWAATDLAVHVGTTLLEVAIGMAIGVPAGAVFGLWLGRAETASRVLRPLIVALYSVPLVTMAPLMILWFGLDLKPKIVLVTIVVFFLIFFNTFSGARKIDRDLLQAFRMMGATSNEELRAIVFPASLAWIMSGVKIAMPYALAAATTGELLAAFRGMGFLLSHAAAQFDMTGLYSALLVLMLMGVASNEVVAALEQRLLRWRHAG